MSPNFFGSELCGWEDIENKQKISIFSAVWGDVIGDEKHFQCAAYYELIQNDFKSLDHVSEGFN